MFYISVNKVFSVCGSKHLDFYCDNFFFVTFLFYLENNQKYSLNGKLDNNDVNIRKKLRLHNTN